MWTQGVLAVEGIKPPFQFVQDGVAASKSVLMSTFCHLKIPLFRFVCPFSPIAYLLSFAGSSNSSLINSIRQSSSVRDSRTTTFPAVPDGPVAVLQIMFQ